jgi:hypothetical protein
MQSSSTALVGVVTNKANTTKQIPVHSPCWCCHQQEKYICNLVPQPLLVLSPTRLTSSKQIIIFEKNNHE